MSVVLRLYEDILSNDAALSLPALPRMIFVVHGAIVVAAARAATVKRGAAKKRSR